MPADFVDRLRDLLATVRSAQVLLASDTDRDGLDRVVRIAVRHTGAAGGLLYLLDRDRGDLRIAAADGAAYRPLVGARASRTGLPGFAIDDGSPIAVAGPGGPDEVGDRIGAPARSQLVAPVLVFGVAAGAIELRDAPGPRGFSPADVELVVELAHVAAAAVEAHRGERLLAAMFAAVLPGALDPARPAASLGDELGRWLDELRAQPEFRRELALAVKLRAVARDAAGLRLAEDLVDAVLRAEAARRP
jgi:GAF domain-containing protein